MKKFPLLLALIMLAVITVASAKGAGSANVKFGKPDEKSNCYGKGICMLTNIGSMQGTVNVRFELLPVLGDSRDLVMVFNINDLRVADPDKANLFVDERGQPRADYSMNYTFTNQELCRDLGIATGELTIRDNYTNVIEMVSNSEIRVTYRIPVNR